MFIRNLDVRTLVERVIERVCEERLDTDFCQEAFDTYIDIIFDSVRAEGTNSTYACQRAALCPYTFNSELLNSTLDRILEGKPAQNITTPSNQSTYTILHLTDVHLDFLYQEVVVQEDYLNSFEGDQCTLWRFLVLSC